jgi:hypothetical protein
LIDYRLHDAQVSFRQIEQQATAGAAASWAARRRASGAPDPLADLPVLDDEALISVGLPLPELAASRRDSFMWSARMYTVTGSASLADACWDLALREAAHVGAAEIAAVQGRASREPLEDALLLRDHDFADQLLDLLAGQADGQGPSSR